MEAPTDGVCEVAMGWCRVAFPSRGVDMPWVVLLGALLTRVVGCTGLDGHDSTRRVDLLWGGPEATDGTADRARPPPVVDPRGGRLGPSVPEDRSYPKVAG